MGKEAESSVISVFPKTLVNALIWGGWKKDDPRDKDTWRRRNNTYDLDTRWMRVCPSMIYPGKVFWKRDFPDGKKYYEPDDPELLDKIVKLKDGWTL